MSGCRLDPERIAIVDVGSTSLKLLIASMDESGRHVVALHEEKRQVHLLSGQSFNQISPEAMMRGLDTMSHFSSVAAQWNVPLRAIATAGLRDADRASAFINQVHEQVSKLCAAQREHDLAA